MITFPTATTTLPRISTLSARTIEAEMVALCDAATVELDAVWCSGCAASAGSDCELGCTIEADVARVTAFELECGAAAARQALTNLASDVPGLAVTVGFTASASFERAFDAGLVSWADDGALVWG